MLKRKQPIKWAEGIPRVAGMHIGKIHGHEFKVDIFTNRPNSHRTTWTIDFDFMGENYTDAGESGGVQRSLSCLRDALETICRQKGIQTP